MKETYASRFARAAGKAVRNAVGTASRRYRAATSTLQRFANEVLADGYQRGREVVVGKMQKEVLADLRAKGITLETGEVRIDDAVVIKYVNHVKRQKGATVDEDKYWLVEKTVNNPKHIYEHTGNKYLVYVNTRSYVKGKALKVVIQPNYTSGGKKYNKIKSIGVVSEENMREMQYRQIK